MRSTHTLITIILATILTILFGVGYFNLVTPNEKQHKQYDTDREGDFKAIVQANQTYFKKNHKLAESLKKLSEDTNHDASSGNDLLQTLLDSFAGVTYRDPQTNQIYGYKYDDITGKNFKLCANFANQNKSSDTSGSQEELSTSSTLFSELFKTSSNSGLLKKIEHDKGYQCLDFSVDDGSAEAEVDYLKQKSTTFDSSGDTTKKANDARRKSDLNKISSGLEQYYNDKSAYPDSLSLLTTGTPPYLNPIPLDPTRKNNYIYILKDGCYKLSAEMEAEATYSLTCKQ